MMDLSLCRSFVLQTVLMAVSQISKWDEILECLQSWRETRSALPLYFRYAQRDSWSEGTDGWFYSGADSWSRREDSWSWGIDSWFWGTVLHHKWIPYAPVQKVWLSSLAPRFLRAFETESSPPLVVLNFSNPQEFMPHFLFPNFAHQPHPHHLPLLSTIVQHGTSKFFMYVAGVSITWWTGMVQRNTCIDPISSFFGDHKDGAAVAEWL